MKNNTVKKGVGILAVVGAAAAAGYYFYTSPEGKKHRKIAAKWAMSMKSDVLKQARALKKIDRKTIESIVANAQKTYIGLKNMDRKEVERAGRELKNNWQAIMKEIGADSAKAKKTLKKTVSSVKKAAKKVAKKVS